MNEIYELKALYKGTETTELRVSFFFQDLFTQKNNHFLFFHNREIVNFITQIQLISRRARAKQYQSHTH